MSVATFTTPHEALDALAASAGFDLVITDQTMPAMTGVEFAHAARALRAGLPIVLSEYLQAEVATEPECRAPA